MKKVFYFVTEKDAEKALWRQILCGDITDNIPGCWRLGPVRAAEIVDEMFETGTSPEDMWKGVISEYQFSKLKPGCPYLHLDSQQVAIETAQLVYMQRQPEQLWAPPGVPFGYVKGHGDD
jgi:5'-3' exonuclease